MKRLLSLTLLVTLVACLQAAPVLPGDLIAPLESAISTARAGASDPKIISALDKASTALGAAEDSDLGAVLKAFSKSVGGLLKVDAPAEVDAALLTAYSNLLSYAVSRGQSESNRLNSAVPGKVHDAAARSIAQALGYLNGLDPLTDFVDAAKLLVKSGNKLRTVPAAVDRALAVPPPPAEVRANVSGSSSFSYNSMVAGAIAFSSGNGIINSAQAVTKAPYGQRGVAIALIGVTAGANTLPITAHNGGGCELLVTELYGNGVHSNYGSTSGTMNVTYNPATKSLVGTFNATCVDGAKTITITGSFSAVTQ